MTALPISAFIVTKDGAALLPSAIANLRHFASEVLVIVDAESRDESWPVAHELADRAELWTVDGSYESVLNEAAAVCRHDWILYGHDDELWTPACVALLPSLLYTGKQEFIFPRKHIVGQTGSWITSAPWFPDGQLRLRSRAAWQQYPWPRRVHAVPEPWQRMTVQTPIWHLKFLVKSENLRKERLARWGEMWDEARSDHYRRFSLPEGYDWQTGPCDEEPPAEFAAMLAAEDSNKEAA